MLPLATCRANNGGSAHSEKAITGHALSSRHAAAFMRTVTICYAAICAKHVQRNCRRLVCAQKSRRQQDGEIWRIAPVAARECALVKVLLSSMLFSSSKVCR